MFDDAYRDGKEANIYSATVNPDRDTVLVRSVFDDCDAYIVQRNRITELIRKEKMKVGDTVSVQRTSGEVESDWKIESIGSNNIVTVRKDNLTKQVNYEGLLEMNTDSGFGF